VHGDRSGVKTQRTIGVSLRGEVPGEVRVLDDVRTLAAAAEDADFFVGLGLADHLAGDFGRAVWRIGVQADEQGVEHLDQRVVDLDVADVLDAASGHVLDGTAGGQGADRAAVAVGVHRDRALVGQE
jgi:hypothetical protein